MPIDDQLLFSLVEADDISELLRSLPQTKLNELFLDAAEIYGSVRDHEPTQTDQEYEFWREVVVEAAKEIHARSVAMRETASLSIN